MTCKKLEDWLVLTTEKFLTYRKRRILIKKEKTKKRPAFVELLYTILFVVAAVMLINMFLFQNYRIPSRSMVSTLEVGDLIFVEKPMFGPEILPGTLKIPAFREVKRGEVISFESEKYAQNGPVIEFFHRFVYFITFSFANLKQDPQTHEPVVDLLIKRAIGLPGESVRIRHDTIEIRREFENTWIPEEQLINERPVPYTIASNRESNFRDFIEQSPYDRKEFYHELFYKACNGWYIPPGMFFPMGDKRDESRDARVYGPVPVSRIQGKAVFRFFPFSRAGAIY
ncbi:MAG: signal peptidase I [Spirochaetales bacterium]|nr:signal peptidase I [Spirochaetales bacterium]